MFESLPESIIQSISMLSNKPEDLSFVIYLGIASSVVAVGVIFTDSNLSMARLLFAKAPKSPQYNWIPTDFKAFIKCFGGYCLFTATYFSCNVFAISLAYLNLGGHAIFKSIILVEFALVVLYKHFVDGEMFAAAGFGKTSTSDYVMGVVVKFIYYFFGFIGPSAFVKCPCELGPHVHSALIAWRMVSGSGVVVLALPQLVNDGTLPWMSVTGGMAFYFSCLVVSWIGAIIFFGYMDEGCEKSRWWKRQTGKQYFEEVWDAQEVWSPDKYETKEEEIASWLLGIHPIYFNMDRVRSWICDDLVKKYSIEGESVECHFLTQKLHDRLVKIFTWWGKKEALRKVNEALAKLPVYTPPAPIVESISGKLQEIRTERTKGRKENVAKVAPQELGGG